MNREEAIRILRLLTEIGQDRMNKAIEVAVKDMIEADRKEKMNGFKQMEVRTGDMRQAHGHLPW